MSYDYTSTINLQDMSLDLTFSSSDFQELANWLAFNTDAKVIDEQWQSKYNEYVIFNYKPFQPESFDYCVRLFYNKQTDIEYADFILDKEIEKRGMLEKMLLAVGDEN